MELIDPQQRKESNCTCFECKFMCKASPCFPTPQEVEQLVAAGYRDQLLTTLWGSIDTGKLYALVSPKQMDHGCIFQDREGLCALHDKGLKPLEGRLASHDAPDNGLREWIASKWNTEEGERVIRMFDADADLIFTYIEGLNKLKIQTT